MLLVQPREARQKTSATFQLNNSKFYASVVTLSINYNNKFLVNVKLGFKKNNFLKQI